eukprot:SAG31_NODE_1090_length_9967_cov_66.880726_4_plen_43_part_00
MYRSALQLVSHIIMIDDVKACDDELTEGDEDDNDRLSGGLEW